MARATKSGAQTAKKTASTVNLSFVEWAFRPAMLFRLALVAGVAALWPYAIQRLPSLKNRPEYQLTFEQIQISPSPVHPVPSELIEQVSKLADLPRELSILDEKLTKVVAEAFARHPWVAKVVRVQKSHPATIKVELIYRQPVATIHTANGRIPIDVDAVVLPVNDFTSEDLDRFPVIQAVSSRPAARAGITWSDPAVHAAAKLASTLQNRWKALKLEAILVPGQISESGNVDDITLELLGLGGSHILWGRVPGSDYPGELDAEQKIRRLENYLAEFGDYGQPKGPYEIDIRHWRENSRRPLPSQASQSKPARGTKEGTRIQNSDARRKARS